MAINIYSFMEDFDNEELSDYDRKEQLKEAVQDYNAKFNYYYDIDITVRRYEGWKKEKYKPDM